MEKLHSTVGPATKNDGPSYKILISVNGAMVKVPAGTTVAAAVLIAGFTGFRRSVSEEPRGPLCGMGVCFECRVQIGGVRHARSCQVLCADGMQVTTE